MTSRLERNRGDVEIVQRAEVDRWLRKEEDREWALIDASHSTELGGRGGASPASHTPSRSGFTPSFLAASSTESPMLSLAQTSRAGATDAGGVRAIVLMRRATEN